MSEDRIRKGAPPQTGQSGKLDLGLDRRSNADGSICDRPIGVSGGMRSAAAVLSLQRLVGNRATSLLMSRDGNAENRATPTADRSKAAGPELELIVQRAPENSGWDKADSGGPGWNTGAKDVAGTKIRRIPVDGLEHGNQAAFSGAESDKTTESAKGRAIALVPEGIHPDKPVDVFLHLHGYTNRAVDPYAGWRERKKDHTVRDVDWDRIEAQMDAAANPQLIGILPQGVGHSDFGKFDADPYIKEVMTRLTTVVPFGEEPSKIRVVYSAHSGGGNTLIPALAKDKPGKKGHIAEVVLFEAIWPKGQDKMVADWAIDWLERVRNVVESTGDEQAKETALDDCPVLRAYYSGSTPVYVESYGYVKTALDTWFSTNATKLGTYYTRLRNRFQVRKVSGTNHETLIHGLDSPAAGPLADALRAEHNPDAPSLLHDGSEGHKSKDTGTHPNKQTTKTPGHKGHAGSASNLGRATTNGVAATHTARPNTNLKTTDDLGPSGLQTVGPDFIANVDRTTLERLPAEKRARFEAIRWVDLDYPGSSMVVKDVSESNLANWRSNPDYELFQSGKDQRWYIKGAHQADAQALMDALAAVRPGGGERRANLGDTAILTQSQFAKDPAGFDKYITSQLDGPSQVTLKMNKYAYAKMLEVQSAAKADGVDISINNAFRPRKVAEANAAKKGNSKAVASYSSHSLGLAMDLNLWTKAMGKRVSEVSTAMTNVSRMFGAPAYKWMYVNGARFGFYQYRNEPWHWEYNPPGFTDLFWSEAPADLKPTANAKPRTKVK